LYSNPASRTNPILIGASIFFLFYLLPLAIFGAKLQAKVDGLHVEQYSSTVLSYTQVRACFGLFLFPVQMVIVLTSQNLPLRILISGDVFVGGRNGLFRDGKLACSIKEHLGRVEHP